MIATCVRAQDDVRKNAADRSPLELANVFCRHSRRKIEKLFEDVRDNADPETYDLARGILDKRFTWLENGIVDAPEAPEHVEATPARAAAGR
jgi:hypothetical protein